MHAGHRYARSFSWRTASISCIRSYFGAFNLFGYVFSPGRLGEHRKYKSFAHYCQIQEENRARQAYYFVPYYVVGIGVLLFSLLLA